MVPKFSSFNSLTQPFDLSSGEPLNPSVDKNTVVNILMLLPHSSSRRDVTTFGPITIWFVFIFTAVCGVRLLNLR